MNLRIRDAPNSSSFRFYYVLAHLKIKRPTMLRTLHATVLLLSLVIIPGCGVSEPPAEASGEAVSATYEQDQKVAQQKAMEEAMNKNGR